MKLRFHHDGGNEHYHDEDDNGRVYSKAEVNKMLNADEIKEDTPLVPEDGVTEEAIQEEFDNDL